MSSVASNQIAMARVRLTSSFVRRATCAANARKTNFFDSRQPGFLLEVRASGGKTFYQRYRDRRGRERQFKIGSAAILTVAVARRHGKRVLAQALVGHDPQDERKELRTIPSFDRLIRDRYLPYAMSAKRSWRTDETILLSTSCRRLGGHRSTRYPRRTSPTSSSNCARKAIRQELRTESSCC